jgi:hypothetical protein
MVKSDVNDDLRTLARDLKGFMVKQHGIRDSDGPTPLADDWRSWELSFSYKGHRRHYVYHVQRQDSLIDMWRALQAESTGELMVTIPTDDGSGLNTNEIYYPPHG